MRFIPPEGLEEKHRNSVLTELEYESSEKLLRLYYGNLSIEGDLTQSQINIPSEIFRPADANVINAVANFLAENLQRYERGDADSINFYDSFFLAFDDQPIQIHARLNSRGVVQIAAKTIVPYLVAFFLSMPDALADADVVQNLKASNVEVINSMCPDKGEHIELMKEGLFGILNMIGEEDISEICRRVREFKSRTGATVKSEMLINPEQD